MDFLEKDLEEIIFNTDSQTLYNRGLYVFGKRKRQLKIGQYGIADMITLKRPCLHPYLNFPVKGVVTVYEFKKDTINVSAFLQAVRYLKGIQRYLEKRNKNHLYDYEICLVGKSIDLNSSFSYLTDIVSSNIGETPMHFDSRFSLSVYTYSYDIDGLMFTQEYNYKQSSEGF